MEVSQCSRTANRLFCTNQEFPRRTRRAFPSWSLRTPGWPTFLQRQGSWIGTECGSPGHCALAFPPRNCSRKVHFMARCLRTKSGSFCPFQGIGGFRQSSYGQRTFALEDRMDHRPSSMEASSLGGCRGWPRNPFLRRWYWWTHKSRLYLRSQQRLECTCLRKTLFVLHHESLRLGKCIPLRQCAWTVELLRMGECSRTVDKCSPLRNKIPNPWWIVLGSRDLQVLAQGGQARHGHRSNQCGRWTCLILRS